MIFGNPSIFAIESHISKAYEAPGLRALGYFVIYVKSHCYGVRSANATMLACSYDRVGERIMNRCKHVAPFAAEADAGEIANAFRSSIFADSPDENYLGVSHATMRQLFYTQPIDRMWAPDGDEAFDDGSYVLQFDIHDHVRLIAFRCGEDGMHDPATLSDVWLSANDFYDTLQQWHDAFKAEWETSPKTAENDGI